ncbi:MAG: hypothetical protein R6X16_06045 [Anaerolineae bacterium]
MMPDDLDPVTRRSLGRTLVRVGFIVIFLGVAVATAIALTPTDPEVSSAAQNAWYGVGFCLGPALLAGVPSIIVGRGMMRREKRDDIGSLYRGDY